MRMAFHPLDLIVIVGIALLIFGPKTLQSISHNAGRGMGHAKEMKGKLMSELPMEELSKVGETIARIPTSPQQVAQKLVSSALQSGEKKDPVASAIPEDAAVEPK
jgi:Sec-independent protein translocase protein TatA